MSDTNTPTAPENIQNLNKELIDRVLESADGEVKQASAAGTNMIRRRIREEGFTRRILPPQTVTNEDLDRVVNHDRPVMIEDMEPHSRGSKSIPFGDAADTEFYYGNKYICVFNPITTPEFTKDINELRTYRMDLRQVITDNSLKDVQYEEDGKFIAMCDTIVGTEGATDGAAGIQQAFYNGNNTTATIDNSLYDPVSGRLNYAKVLSILEDQMLNNGVILMNRRTAKAFLTYNRTMIGGDLSQELFKEGLSALSEAKVFGIKHIFTIKRDLIPDNCIYLFTEPGFLGKFYELQQLIMYVEKKKDILRFSARETISVTIANVAGIARFRFPPAVSGYSGG